MKIIFVCHGNICRSPMAEFIMKELVKKNPKVEISSAAVSYEEQGNPLYGPAAATLQRHNIPFGPHRAHRITKEEGQKADLIVIMDGSNERLLSRIIREEDAPKVKYMMEFTPEGKRDVADPWYTGDFERSYRDILSGCKAMAEALNLI